MNEPTHLDLFSGIGGFAKAAKWAGFRTIGFCEIDKYCQKVLAKNFMDDAMCDRENERNAGRMGHSQCQEEIVESESGSVASTFEYCRPRLFSNIFDLNGRDFAGASLITGGFPCQPFSVAGKRGGASDDRAIWPEMFRVISEARPAWVLGENVPGIIPMELDNVLSDLEGIGYATRTFVIPACAVDARHRRDRVWIIGRRISGEHQGWRCPAEDCFSASRGEIGDNATISNTGSQRGCNWKGVDTGNKNATNVRQRSKSQKLGDTEREGLERYEGDRLETCRGEMQIVRPDNDGFPNYWQWNPEPDVGRVANGIPNRVDRLKGLGNAIVPQVAYEILREIRKLC